MTHKQSNKHGCYSQPQSDTLHYLHQNYWWYPLARMRTEIVLVSQLVLHSVFKKKRIHQTIWNMQLSHWTIIWNNPSMSWSRNAYTILEYKQWKKLLIRVKKREREENSYNICCCNVEDNSLWWYKFTSDYRSKKMQCLLIIIQNSLCCCLKAVTKCLAYLCWWAQRNVNAFTF